MVIFSLVHPFRQSFVMICVSLRVYLFLFKRLCVEWWKKVCSFYSSLGSHHIASAPLAKYTRSSLPTLRFALVNFFCATFKAIQTRFAASPLRFFIFLYCSSISLCLFLCIIYIFSILKTPSLQYTNCSLFILRFYSPRGDAE